MQRAGLAAVRGNGAAQVLWNGVLYELGTRVVDHAVREPAPTAAISAQHGAQTALAAAAARGAASGATLARPPLAIAIAWRREHSNGSVAAVVAVHVADVRQSP